MEIHKIVQHNQTGPREHKKHSEETQDTRDPGLVSCYNILSGNRSGLFFQSRNPREAQSLEPIRG